jgi:hypothetical protein
MDAEREKRRRGRRDSEEMSWNIEHVIKKSKRK